MRTPRHAHARGHPSGTHGTNPRGDGADALQRQWQPPQPHRSSTPTRLRRHTPPHVQTEEWRSPIASGTEHSARGGPFHRGRQYCARDSAPHARHGTGGDTHPPHTRSAHTVDDALIAPCSPLPILERPPPSTLVGTGRTSPRSSSRLVPPLTVHGSSKPSLLVTACAAVLMRVRPTRTDRAAVHERVRPGPQ